jgi:transglutaminase-like putative cysteine protease
MSDVSTHALPCGRYRVVHETRYSYQSPVTLSQQYVHLTPRSFPYQQTESHQIWVDPVAQEVVEGLDYFGNSTQHLAITTPHQTLLVHAESTVVLTARYDLEQINGTLPWETLRDSIQQDRQPAMLDACRYLYASPHVTCGPELEDYARISYTAGRPQLDAALDLTQRIFDDFEFDDKATEISTPLEAVLAGRRGVCQDFAQLMIGCLRTLGLPARYVSG